MNKHVELRLTIKEAEALRYALGQTTEHPDAMAATFDGDSPGYTACRRAESKLDDAILTAKGCKQ